MLLHIKIWVFCVFTNEFQMRTSSFPFLSSQQRAQCLIYSRGLIIISQSDSINKNILDCSDCYNIILQTGFINSRDIFFIFLEASNLKIKVLKNPVTGEGPFPSWHMLCPHVAEGAMLLRHFNKDANSIQQDSAFTA